MFPFCFMERNFAWLPLQILVGAVSDCHSRALLDVIERTETLTGCPIERAYVDKGYRGHEVCAGGPF